MNRLPWLLVCCVLTMTGCGSRLIRIDGGPLPEDAGVDAGSDADAGPGDAGPIDAGLPDGGDAGK